MGKIILECPKHDFVSFVYFLRQKLQSENDHYTKKKKKVKSSQNLIIERPTASVWVKKLNFCHLL